MEIFTSKADLLPFLERHRANGSTIGLVPTMGALHVGHLSLVERSVAENDITICTIFVNPTQFNNEGDLVNYPRREEEDTAKLAPTGCQVVFIPPVTDIYPPDEDPEAYVVNFGFLETVMEGRHRPGHFRGVGIIIGKFFEMMQPTRAYFGEKDYQQLMVIKKLNTLKEYGVDVVGCPTFREESGLAMSSRNLRLTPIQLDHAALIHQNLTFAREQAGKQPLEVILKAVADAFAADPVMQLEYFDIANADTLEAIQSWDEAPRWVACTAAFAGEVRLIDNLRLN